MFENIWIGIVLTFYTVLNIIVPLSGSATVTPLLAILTDPHKAIGLAIFYFFLSSLVRLYLFRKFIQWEEAKHLIIPSAIAVLLGSLSLVVVSTTLLYIIVLGSAVYFLLKKLKIIEWKKAQKLTSSLVGVFSGFLQGTGLAGSDLRNSHLYSQGLSISEVHGTTAVIGSLNFFIATVTRLLTQQMELVDLSPLIFIFPFIVIGTLTGRLTLNKIDKKLADYIVIAVMVAMIIGLSLKLYRLWG